MTEPGAVSEGLTPAEAVAELERFIAEAQAALEALKAEQELNAP